MRENRGEIELKKVPAVIAYGSCYGDFQVHTTWSDGQHSVDEMARAAQALGWKFITITDHVGQVGITKPLNEKRLEQQWKEIDKVQKKVDIRIFKGAEVDILKDGKLALSRTYLEKLDVVLASVHLATKMSSSDMTRRIVTALESNRVHILGHPTGRLLNQREGYSFDFGKVFEACKRTGTRLDIDCHPERMDLPDVHVKSAREVGCGFAVSTDSHSAVELKHLQLGEAIARRGWLEEKDVLNTYSVKEIEKKLKK
jgi:DNA polymerase (family 10)